MEMLKDDDKVKENQMEEKDNDFIKRKASFGPNALKEFR